jgi:hypothetical protein
MSESDKRRGRFSDEVDPLDFNRVPSTRRKNTLLKQKRAAARLASKRGQKRLVAFLDALDRAHDLLGTGARNDSLAIQTAFSAVTALLEATRENYNGYYSRIFQLLADNHKRRYPEASLAGPKGAGAGGVNRDSRSHAIKAATAFFIEYLKTSCGQNRKVRLACLEAAKILTQRGFSFSGSKANPKGTNNSEVLNARASTIEMWRRGFLVEGGGGEAGELFRRYTKKAPFPRGATPYDKASNAYRWWHNVVWNNS